MRKITCICVGKVREKSLTQLLQEYEKRLSRYCKWNWIEVADSALAEGECEARREQILREEGERILHVLPEGAFVVALDIAGKAFSSEELADWIRQRAVQGVSHLVFLIGGSVGLSGELLARSDMRLSFSKLTFPHQLMRLLLAEQIYRACRIINGEPYHK